MERKQEDKEGKRVCRLNMERRTNSCLSSSNKRGNNLSGSDVRSEALVARFAGLTRPMSTRKMMIDAAFVVGDGDSKEI